MNNLKTQLLGLYSMYSDAEISNNKKLMKKLELQIKNKQKQIKNNKK